METIVENLIFPESLRWHKGELWFADMYDGKIFSMTPGSDPRLIHSRDTVIGGIDWLENGDLIYADKQARKIYRINGNTDELFADLSSFGTSRLNDLVLKKDGTCFVDEYGFDVTAGEKPKKGSIFSISPNGDIDRVANDVAFGNTMLISFDQAKLYLSETTGNRLSRFDISDGGMLTNRETLVEFDRGFPDGMCLSPDQNIWVALIAKKALVKVSPTGDYALLPLDTTPYDVILSEETPTHLYIATSEGNPQDLHSAAPPRKGKILKLDLDSVSQLDKLSRPL